MTAAASDLRLAMHRRRKRINVLALMIVMIVVGFLAGLLARAIVPGSDPMGLVGTTVLGIVGSFIGGFIGYLLFRDDAEDGALQPSGFIGSVIGGIVALLIYRAMNGRRHRTSY